MATGAAVLPGMEFEELSASPASEAFADVEVAVGSVEVKQTKQGISVEVELELSADDWAALFAAMGQAAPGGTQSGNIPVLLAFEAGGAVGEVPAAIPFSISIRAPEPQLTGLLLPAVQKVRAAAEEPVEFELQF